MELTNAILAGEHGCRKRSVRGNVRQENSDELRVGKPAGRIGVSEPKQQEPDSIDPAPAWLRERNNDPVPLARIKDKQDWPAQRKLDETVAHLRAVADRDSRVQKQPDIFADAVAKALQEELEPELVEAPSVLRHHQSLGIAARLAVAAGVAAVAALVFAVAFPSSQGPAEEDALSAQPTLRSLTSSLFPASQRKPAPTLVVRDGSGPADEPLSLGVNVNSPAPGAAVTINGMPATATLTVGRRMSASEWRVPAQEISDASIIPPADFVGVMNLTAELRGSDGAALVNSYVRLTWTSARPGGIVGMSASAATVPSGPAAPTPQQQQPTATPAPPAATRAEPLVREIDPNEVAAFVKRAQELLTTGDLQAARLLLRRAAEAHDSRAALLLAKTFDPIASKQFGAADPESDLVQARNWYQKAEEWGAPEAQRQLEALANR
jgi:hypothetical protein